MTVPLVDLLIVGLGPGGAAAALAAKRLGVSTLAVESRGPEPTRSQLVLIRPGARTALARIGFPDITDGRRTTTIREVESRLRGALQETSATESKAGFAHCWNTRVVSLREDEDHVNARLSAGRDGQCLDVRARYVLDASGGRLEVPGRKERARVGCCHWVITAEYTAAPWFDGIVGVRDPRTHDLCMLFPTWGRRGVIAYLDAKPGRDEAGAGMRTRLETLAKSLDLGYPRYEPWAVDVAQRLLPERSRGRVLPIGDSVGTVDVLTGNGMSTAIEDAVLVVEAMADARGAGLRPLTAGALAKLHAALYARHRRAVWRGRAVLAVRPVLERAWPGSEMPCLSRDTFKPPPLLWPTLRLIFGRRPAAMR